jgi:hypothetical protein
MMPAFPEVVPVAKRPPEEDNISQVIAGVTVCLSKKTLAPDTAPRYWSLETAVFINAPIHAESFVRPETSSTCIPVSK